MAQQMKTSLITTDNTNEDIQQIQIYAKDSLDRFGDDLCSLLLSYFTFEDRFRYECVSKQFQRTVFESVIDITINDNFILKLMLKLLLTKTTTPYEMAIIAKKCPNIETIDCRGIIFTHEEHTLEVLNTFRDNCPHLRHIYCDIRPNTCQLFPTFGRLVTKINVIQSWNESVKQSLNETLSHCHRLSYLKTYDFSDCFDSTSGQLIVKNLHKLLFSFSKYSVKESQQLSAFVAHNQSLKSIKTAIIESQTHETVAQIAEQLSRLTQLRELTLILRLINSNNSLNKSLRIIGLNCKQIQRLRLYLQTSESQLNRHSLDSLRCYHRLKRLHLTVEKPINEEVLEPLKLCHRLTHLSLYFEEMSDKLSLNCGKHWPRLQCLSIGNNEITVECLDHISRLPALKTLELHILCGIALRDSDIEDLFFKSPKLIPFLSS